MTPNHDTRTDSEEAAIVKKAIEADIRPSVIADEIHSRLPTMSRVPEQNKIISEIMEIKLDNETKIRLTLKYDPFSLVQERNRITIDEISQGVLRNLGQIEWDFELETFLARLIAIWSKNYQIAPIEPAMPAPVIEPNSNNTGSETTPPFEQPGTIQ